MALPTETPSRRVPEDLYWTLRAADRDVGFCLLSFPISTFFGALLIGLCGSLPAMHPSGAPFWIVLGVCALFSAGAVLSARSARRIFAEAGMHPQEVRRRIAGLWIIVAVFMLGAGTSALGHLAVTFDPDRMGAITFFGPLDRPLPLVIALTLYVLAGAWLLRRSWRKAQEAKKNAPELSAGSLDADKAAAWTRNLELYTALRTAGGGVALFVVGTILLALMIGLGNSSDGNPDASRLLIIGLFALASGISVLWVRRSRHHFDAAGLSPEEVRHEMASTWRLGGFVMVLIGAGALAFVILAFDVLHPADRPWSLGSALGYISIGLLLLWKNWQKRGG